MVDNIPSKIGKYEVVRKLGSGAFGTVFLARDTAGRQVAIKVLRTDHLGDHEQIARLFREAKADQAVCHSGLVTVHDFVAHSDDAPFIVMEYLDGQTLEERVRSSSHGLTLDVVIDVALHVSDALAAAHESEVIHRDLKPANIMLVKQRVGPGHAEVAKVLDFGLARMTHHQSEQDGFETEVGREGLGTRRYCSPEQFQDATAVDGKTDVYALGLVMLHALAGRFPKSVKLELMQLSTLHKDVAELISRMVGSAPEQRPNMREVHAILTRLDPRRLGGGVGAVGRALALSKLPTLTRWSEGLDAAYSSLFPSRSYSEYVQELRAPNAPRDEETRLALVINHCVEGEVKSALEELEEIDASRWSPQRRTAYHRLRGALLRERGASVAARQAYTDALSTWGSRGPAVERAIGLELLSLREEEEGRQHEVERLRALDECSGTLACDYARTQSADAFASECFDATLRSEGTMRLRNGMPEEIGWYNASLAVAYLTGSFGEARDARITFARSVVGLGVAPDDPDGLALAAREMLTARASGDLEKLLAKKGHLLADKLEWDRIVCDLRPAELYGPAAEATWQTLLAVIKTMAPYLGAEATSRTLTEMLTAAGCVADGEKHQFLEYFPAGARGFRARTYFIDAMTALGHLSASQLMELLGILAKTGEDAVRRQSLWNVVAAHTWSPTDRPAAEEALRLLLVTPLTDQNDDLVVEICSGIASCFPDLRGEIASWFLTTNDLLAADRWRVFLTTSFPDVEPNVREWIGVVVSEECADMSTKGPRDGYRVSAWTRARLVAPAYKLYPNQFPRTEYVKQLTLLFEATANPHLYVERKAAVFATILQVLRADPSADFRTLHSAASTRLPSEEQGRDSRAFSLGDRSTSVAQLRLLELRLTLSIPSSPSDLLLLLDGITAGCGGMPLGSVVRSASADVPGSATGPFFRCARCSRVPWVQRRGLLTWSVRHRSYPALRCFGRHRRSHGQAGGAGWSRELGARR
jgi:serine/threonine protein kinase